MKIESQVKKYVRAEKAKRGYSRISETNDKNQMQSAILADAINTLKTEIDDVGHPIFMDIRQKFDKI